MSVFVIGGTGFIGTRVIPLLIARGESVVCMDINPHTANFSAFGDKVRVIRGDVTQFDDVINQMQASGADRVIVSAFTAAPPALRDALVVRLKARGMLAEAGDPDAAQGVTLLVQGQSSTPTRPVMGLTAPGRTAAAEVQVLYVAGSAAPQFLESFGVEAADTQRLADVIAERIATFAAGQAWIAGTKKGGS